MKSGVGEKRRCHLIKRTFAGTLPFRVRERRRHRRELRQAYLILMHFLKHGRVYPELIQRLIRLLEVAETVRRVDRYNILTQMPIDPVETVYYRRARFSTRLPRDRFYVRAHYWLEARGANVWRVGLTRFATRMLGDLVEYSFDRRGDDQIEVGQNIGWIEGFKAVSDVFCAVNGRFVRSNPALEFDTTLVDNDPYDAGWLYEVRGEPEPDHLDVDGYVNLLDATIDRMLSQANEEGAACPVPGTS